MEEVDMEEEDMEEEDMEEVDMEEVVLLVLGGLLALGGPKARRPTGGRPSGMSIAQGGQPAGPPPPAGGGDKKGHYNGQCHVNVAMTMCV